MFAEIEEKYISVILFGSVLLRCGSSIPVGEEEQQCCIGFLDVAS